MADQRRARPARRRARPAPRPSRGPDRRRRPRHVPRGTAAAGLAVLRSAQRDRHAAHLVVQRSRPRSDDRAVLRQPAALRRGRTPREPGRSGRRLLNGPRPPGPSEPGALADADRDRRTRPVGQDDGVQHADPRPRRNRRVRRDAAQRRRRQGARRAPRAARRDLQAQEGRPRRRHLRRSAGAAASTEGHIGTEELPAEHLARLRDSDALLHVVRAFENPAVPHAGGHGRRVARRRTPRPRVHPRRPRGRRTAARTAAHAAGATGRRPSARPNERELGDPGAPPRRHSSPATRSATSRSMRTRRRRSVASGS